MINDPNSKLLRIFIGELDKVGHSPLYEELVYAAKKTAFSRCYRNPRRYVVWR